jgi:hypothetical protein
MKLILTHESDLQHDCRKQECLSMTTSALKFYKTNFLCYFFLICILNSCFFTNKNHSNFEFRLNIIVIFRK